MSICFGWLLDTYCQPNIRSRFHPQQLALLLRVSAQNVPLYPATNWSTSMSNAATLAGARLSPQHHTLSSNIRAHALVSPRAIVLAPMLPRSTTGR